MKAVAAVLGVMLCAALFGSGLARAAEDGNVYLWVDKNGTPHYEDRPPDSQPSKEMNIRYKVTDPSAVAAANEHKAELSQAAQTREKQQGEEKAANDQDKHQVLSEREKGCNEAKARLEKYDTAHRLYRPGPDGTRIYLTDEELDAARADARKTVDQWCGSQ